MSCGLPSVDARQLDWAAFQRYRGSPGVVLKGLFQEEELRRWRLSAALFLT